MRLELEQTASIPAPMNTQTSSVSSNSGINNFDKILADGIAAAQSGNRTQARMLLQYAVEIDRRSEAGWLWLASISEYPEELLIFLDHVLDINPKNVRAGEWKTATNQLMAKTFVQRGIDASKEGLNDHAMDCFDKALSFDEQNQLAWFWKDSMSKDDLTATAQDVPVAAAVTFERSVRTIILDAEASLADGNRQHALALVDEAIELDPESEKAWALRSHLVDDFDDKQRSLERVVEINPDNETCKAALETLQAMVETVTPDIDDKREPAAERLMNTPFDEVAHPMTLEHENSPTQELELPQAILDHNPFIVTENADMQAEAISTGSEAEISTTLADEYTEGGVSHMDYPTIEVPYVEASEIYTLSDEVDEQTVPVQHFQNYRMDESEPSWSETYTDPTDDAPVHEVSAAAYLEEEQQQLDEVSSVDVTHMQSPDLGEEKHASVLEASAPSAWVIDDVIDTVADDADPGRTILVVDDSPVVRKLIAGKLEESGYNVISAGSGAEAMAMISNATPDLVLLDIAMPKMDGYQVCENIRKNGSAVPVVLISGKDGYYDENRAQRAGTSSFISKPFGPETLMKALETYLPSA